MQQVYMKSFDPFASQSMIALALKVAFGWQVVGRGYNPVLANLRGKRVFAQTSVHPGSISTKAKSAPNQDVPVSANHVKSEHTGRRMKQPTDKAASVLAIKIMSRDVAQIQSQNEWVDLNVSASELRPSATLTNGQCFNWMAVHTTSSNSSMYEGDLMQDAAKRSAWGVHDAVEWVGPFDNWVLSIRETTNSTWFRVLAGPNDTFALIDQLRSYFQLETPLEPLYGKWSNADPKRMKRIARALPGVRVVRQDPLECLISFICSSNNNIPRIKLILSRLRRAYGIPLLDVPVVTADTRSEVITLYSFPTLQALDGATESDLRNLGLGYRAKYVTQTVNLLKTVGGKDYLLGLRGKDADFVQRQLVKFHGVGRKVADCVALFSLDATTAIPVDVHVQQIACRDYGFSAVNKSKSLTPAIYKQVGNAFRTRFDSHAGWAHSLLFAAELPSFRPALPADIVEEMDRWREKERKRKDQKAIGS